MSVADACKELGVGPTQFANLREQMLQGALDALEPRPVGRP
ncbi:MAG: helix-turn-helix domain-containing protein, partial [Planctomycetota bacterium]